MLEREKLAKIVKDIMERVSLSASTGISKVVMPTP
jgi:hypothetical protein